MQMPTARLALASILAISLLFTSCGKSVEGETRSWNNHKLELEKFASKYAGLKGAIGTHVADAQKAYDEAQKVTEEDAKAKALSLANQKLLQVLTPFRNLDKVMLEVDALKKDPAVLKLSAEQVNPAIKLADAGVDRAKSLLDGKGVDSSGALVAKVEEAARVATNGAAELKALKAKVAAIAEKQAREAADKAKAEAAEKAKTAPAGDKPPATGTGSK